MVCDEGLLVLLLFWVCMNEIILVEYKEGWLLEFFIFLNILGNLGFVVGGLRLSLLNFRNWRLRIFRKRGCCCGYCNVGGCFWLNIWWSFWIFDFRDLLRVV